MRPISSAFQPDWRLPLAGQGETNWFLTAVTERLAEPKGGTSCASGASLRRVSRSDAGLLVEQGRLAGHVVRHLFLDLANFLDELVYGLVLAVYAHESDVRNRVQAS